MRTRLLAICCAVLASGPAWAATRASPDLNGPDPDFVAVERGVTRDATLGVPRLLWGVAARAPRLEGALRKPADLEAAARQRLAELAPSYRLGVASLAAVETLEVRNQGTRLVRFGQRFAGLPVLERELSFTLDGAGGLILATGNLSPSAPAAGFAIDATAAFATAWRMAGGDDDATPAPRLAPFAVASDWASFAAEAQTVGRWRLVEGARVRQGWLLEGTALRPAYDFELTLRDGEGLERVFALKVDGATGAALARRSLVSEFTYNHRVWAASTAPFAALDGPQGNSFLPHPSGVPDGSLPVATPRVLRSVNSTVHRPTRPWFNIANATSRDGNQVEAFADVDGGGDSTGAEVTAASVSNAFDFAFDEALDADASPEQLRATLTQAMYVVNDLADWFYLGGFDEAGGNHQQDNFGLGGVGGDRLILQTADADIGGNANATVPADGASPRIQMGVFSGDLTRTLEVDGDAGTTLDHAYPAVGGGSGGVGSATFGPRDFDLTAALVTAEDGAGIDSLDLCEPPTDPAAVIGKIVLVKRGNCFFNEKVKILQDAGAAGVLIHNHTATGLPNGGVIAMGGANPLVTIPSLAISLEDGELLRAALDVGEAFTARLQRDGTPTYDSAADSSIVAHEWGHVLVNRNVITPWPGCGNTDGPCMGPQPQGINEGLADLVAMLYLVPGSTALGSGGTYGQGTWANGKTWTDGAYFGFRRYPYSNDLAKNPLMFRHLAASAPLPVGPPLAYDGGDPVEEHAVGEVIAVTLWDAYAALAASGRYTYGTARNQMRDYLVATLKVTPDAPTFLELRDVFYGVVLARSREDHALFAAAFARRGMGQGAIGPDVHAGDNAGIVESFVVEPTPPPPPPPPRKKDDGGGGDSGTLVLALLALIGARRRLRR